MDCRINDQRQVFYNCVHDCHDRLYCCRDQARKQLYDGGQHLGKETRHRLQQHGEQFSDRFDQCTGYRGQRGYDVLDYGSNVFDYALEGVDHVHTELSHVCVSTAKAGDQVLDCTLHRVNRPGDRVLGFLCGGAGDIHARLDHMNRLDHIRVGVDVVLNA